MEDATRGAPSREQKALNSANLDKALMRFEFLQVRLWLSSAASYGCACYGCICYDEPHYGHAQLWLEYADRGAPPACRRSCGWR